MIVIYNDGMTQCSASQWMFIKFNVCSAMNFHMHASELNLRSTKDPVWILYNRIVIGRWGKNEPQPQSQETHIICYNIYNVLWVNTVQVLRSCSIDIRSEGLWPQLICCASFLSIALYCRVLYLSYLKIRTTIIWYPDVRTSIIYLSEGKDKYCIPIQM